METKGSVSGIGATNVAGAGSAFGTGQAIVRDTGIHMSGPVTGSTTQINSAIGTSTNL